MNDETLLNYWLELSNTVDETRWTSDGEYQVDDLVAFTKARLEVGPQPSLSKIAEEAYMADFAVARLHEIIRDLKPMENSAPYVARLMTVAAAISWPELPLSCDPEGQCDCLG